MEVERRILARATVACARMFIAGANNMDIDSHSDSNSDSDPDSHVDRKQPQKKKLKANRDVKRPSSSSGPSKKKPKVRVVSSAYLRCTSLSFMSSYPSYLVVCI